MKKIKRDLNLEGRALAMIRSDDKEINELGFRLFTNYLSCYKIYKKMRSEIWPGAKNDRRNKPYDKEVILEKKLYVIALKNEHIRRQCKEAKDLT